MKALYLRRSAAMTAATLGLLVSACSGIIGGEGESVVEGTQDPNKIDLTKPLPGESSAGATGVGFARIGSQQWKNSALQLLGLPRDTPAPVADDQRGVERFVFDTDFKFALVGDSTLRQFREVAESLASLATKDDAALASMMPVGAPADFAGRAASLTADLVLRAFRRPPTAEELTTYTAIVTSAGGGTDAEKLRAGARQLALTVLQSPKFLYRVELGDPVDVNSTPAGGRVRLSAYELAARASFALRNAAPDAALLADVKAGKWAPGAAYEAAITAMLADERARDAVLRFHDQLYAIERFGQMTKTSTAHPEFSKELAEDMRQDMRRSIGDVYDSGGGLPELLSTRTGFITARLAPTYGLAASEFDVNYKKTELPLERAGILNRAGWAAFAANDQRRDIIRGLYVSQNLLCETMAAQLDPPKTPASYPDNIRTNRARVEFATSEAVCKGCHGLMNPKGFAFEHLDAMGVYQTMDAGESVKADGKITIDGVSVAFDGSADMMAKIGASRQGQACYAKKWASYLLGYPGSVLEARISEQVAEAASKRAVSIRDVARTVLTSEAFTTRKIAEIAP